MTSCCVHADRSATATIGEATAALRHEHEVILQAVAVLERMAARLAAIRPVSESTLAELVQFLRTFADRCHHGKEEDHLFPAMRAKGAGDALAPFLEEHDEGRGYLRTLGSPTAQPAERAAAARRYAGLLQDHIEREDKVLFPMADGLFTAAEHAALAQAYEDVERRVVGAGGHEGLLASLARLDAAVPHTSVEP